MPIFFSLSVRSYPNFYYRTQKKYLPNKLPGRYFHILI